jgi:hypothetical protein
VPTAEVLHAVPLVVEAKRVDIHLMPIAVAQNKSRRKPRLDLGGMLETELGQGSANVLEIVSVDGQIEVFVEPRLPSEERIDSPAPVDPDRDTGRIETV